MQGIVKGGNNDGGGSKLNIFAQATQPTTKEGIWIQTSKTFSGVGITNSLYRENITYPNGKPTPQTKFGCVKVNNKIYCISGYPYTDNPFEVYDTVTNKWSTLTPMPSARYNFGCVAINNKIYCIGGSTSSSSSSSSVYIYDILTDTWVTGANKIASGNQFSCVVVGTKIYCIGGYTGNVGNSRSEVDIYDTTNNTWTAGVNMPSPRSAMGSALLNNKIYCFGGRNGATSAVSAITSCFDLSTNTWTTETPMPKGREHLGCIAFGTKIYCVCGHYEDGEQVDTYLKDIAIYDTVAKTWSSGASALYDRQEFGCAEINGKIYCIDGSMYGTSATVTLPTEIYDIATNKWTSATMIPLAGTTTISDFTSEKLNDEIFIVGGSSSSSAYNLKIYNTVTGAWRDGLRMPTSRISLASTVIGNKIYCIGGTTGSRTTKNEVYDTTTNIWTTLAVMPEAKVQHTCAPVGTKIFVFGGADYNTPCAYDTVSNSWTTTAIMPTPKYDLSCVAIGTKIYTVGGVGTDSSHIQDAKIQIYDTVANTWTTGANAPVIMGHYTKCVAINGLVYCIGNKENNKVYAYNPATNTWTDTSLIESALSASQMSCIVANDKIYQLCTARKIDVIDLTSTLKSPTNQSLVLLRSFESTGQYFTQLFDIKLSTLADANTRFLTSFDDVWIYENGQYLELPTYYGDGTQWIKFKN